VLLLVCVVIHTHTHAQSPPPPPPFPHTHLPLHRASVRPARRDDIRAPFIEVHQPRRGRPCKMIHPFARASARPTAQHTCFACHLYAFMHIRIIHTYAHTLCLSPISTCAYTHYTHKRTYPHTHIRFACYLGSLVPDRFDDPIVRLCNGSEVDCLNVPVSLADILKSQCLSSPAHTHTHTHTHHVTYIHTYTHTHTQTWMLSTHAASSSADRGTASRGSLPRHIGSSRGKTQ
jgi:hypothetical protein